MAQVSEGQASVASIYVGDLKPEVTEQTLWNVFSSYGQILSIKICRDSHTTVSLGYGYVNFRSTAEADRAMKALNFAPVDGKPCRIMWSMRDPQRRRNGMGNLFLKNIDPSVDSKALYDAFIVFGPIMSCKLATDDYGNSKGYGFIQFYNERDAEEALEKANGVEFLKKKIVVNKFMPKAQRLEQLGERINRFTNVFVKNFKQEWTLEDLKEKFSVFGPITSAVIQKDENGQALGFGFVNFALHEHAAEAVRAMNNYKLPSDSLLFVDRAQKKSERTAMLRSQHEKKKLEFYRRYQNLNLYVKNFDDSFTDEKLRTEFSPFGTIQSAHVMRDESGKSKGFGFVCFTTAEEAHKAMTEMHGKLFDTKPLYVALAQNREERRRMMEQRIYSSSFRSPHFPAPVPIVYQPSGPAGYIPQFPNRFPPMHGVLSRQPSRPMQQISGVGQVYPPHMRQPYVYNQGGSFNQQGYRQRSSGGPHQPSSGLGKPNIQGNAPMVRSHQFVSMPAGYGPAMVHPGYSVHNQPMVRGVHPATQTSVNYVAAEQQHHPKKEEKLSAVTKQTQVLTEEDQKFGDRIFLLSQKVMENNKYDSSLSARLTGLVLDYFKRTDRRNVSDDDIKSAVLDAYVSLTNAGSSAAGSGAATGIATA